MIFPVYSLIIHKEEVVRGGVTTYFCALRAIKNNYHIVIAVVAMMAVTFNWFVKIVAPYGLIGFVSLSSSILSVFKVFHSEVLNARRQEINIQLDYSVSSSCTIMCSS